MTETERLDADIAALERRREELQLAYNEYSSAKTGAYVLMVAGGAACLTGVGAFLGVPAVLVGFIWLKSAGSTYKVKSYDRGTVDRDLGRLAERRRNLDP